MNYKEIVAKAVVGKSKKTSTNTYIMEVDNTPNTILGCWVINNKFSGFTTGDDVLVTGTFDINVWYSYDNDSKTAVGTKTFDYKDTLRVTPKENIIDGKEVEVRSLKQPSVSDVKIEDGKIKLTVEKELAVELVGNTKIKVPVEALDDDYEDLSNMDNINEIKEDYIK